MFGLLQIGPRYCATAVTVSTIVVVVVLVMLSLAVMEIVVVVVEVADTVEVAVTVLQMSGFCIRSRHGPNLLCGCSSNLDG